jgi:hypothetical protein
MLKRKMEGVIRVGSGIWLGVISQKLATRNGCKDQSSQPVNQIACDKHDK